VDERRPGADLVVEPCRDVAEVGYGPHRHPHQLVGYRVAVASAVRMASSPAATSIAGLKRSAVPITQSGMAENRGSTSCR
jgi:hypothetical protein